MGSSETGESMGLPGSKGSKKPRRIGTPPPLLLLGLGLVGVQARVLRGRGGRRGLRERRRMLRGGRGDLGEKKKKREERTFI